MSAYYRQKADMVVQPSCSSPSPPKISDRYAVNAFRYVNHLQVAVRIGELGIQTLRIRRGGLVEIGCRYGGHLSGAGFISVGVVTTGRERLILHTLTSDLIDEPLNRSNADRDVQTVIIQERRVVCLGAAGTGYQ